MSINYVHLLDIDTRDITKDRMEEIELELSVQAKKLKENGFAVIDEEIHPQSNSVKSYFTFICEKTDNIPETKYIYAVFDVRGGLDGVNRLVNERIINANKEGYDVIRHKRIPENNAAFTQILLTCQKKEEVKKDEL